jgi:TonB family protein
MDRLQKKCFIASAGIHLLLALILVIGPAFVSTKGKPDDLPLLDFVPVKTVDALVSGGGNPNAKPPPAVQAPQPQPPVTQPALPQQPEPEKVREPEPKASPKEIVPAKNEEESLEPSNKKKVEISTKLVSRTHESQAEAKARADEKAREDARKAADARRRLARQIGQLADNISSEVSGGTTIELRGPGGGGVPYANFLQAVKTKYANAWVVPDGVTDDQATTVASVTIARDGNVVSSHIIRRSGDSAVDQSVQATLDRVTFAAPLPEDAKESQRTVTINFNVRAKRLLG